MIEPEVAWPREAETECDYLVTVDLRGPLPGPDGAPGDWPYSVEEFTFTVALDGSPSFVCTALDEPSVVLHRFGGTYGAARFRVSTTGETGPASLWLTISNQWGLPVRKAELRSEIRERQPGRAPAAKLVDVVRERTTAATRRPAPSAAPVHPRPQPPGGRSGPERSGPPAPLPVRRPLRTGPQTVTISHAGFNRAWAAWIGDRLKRHGHRVVDQRWDPPGGAPLADLLGELLHAPGPVLLVLGERYFGAGARSPEEWNAALYEVAVPNADRFAAVSLTPSGLPEAAAALGPAGLYDLSESEAEQRVLEVLGLPSGPPRESGDGAHRDGPRFPAQTPRVWGGTPRRNPGFMGRDALLGETRRLLERERGIVTLQGMPGVGKTQLAAEYVYRFGSEYDVVWWVSADDRTSARQQLAELAPALGLSTGAEYGERLRAVREALGRGEPYARWLLILDGADEPDEIEDLVPEGEGHVLITSRNPVWRRHGSALLEVPVYDRAESVAFVRRRAPRLTDAEAGRLAEALEDLPLLLDQNAAWLQDSGMSVDEYLDLLSAGPGLTGTTVSADFPLTFRTALSILVNRLGESCPESVVLLRLCTFFAPGSVPVHLLREMPADDLPESVSGLLSDPRVWGRAIGQLRQYSVARLESTESSPSTGHISLHRMVHQAVRTDMPDEERGVFAGVVRRALAAADPRRPADPDAWPRYGEIVPHLEYADVLGSTDPVVSTLVLNCLRHLYLSGEYGTGVRFAEQALTAWQERLGAHAELLWDLGHHYANLLRACGDYEHSEAVSRTAVEQYLAVSGRRNLGYLRAVGGLAADLRALARYEEALALSQEVVEGYEELLGTAEPRTLSARNNTAVSLRLLGRYSDALTIDRRTLQDRRRILGARDVWALFSAIYCATDLRLLGRYSEAAQLQEQNLALHQEVLGPTHPQTLRAEHNFALCLYRGGDRERAGPLFARVLRRAERVLGDTDPLTLLLATSQSCFARDHGSLDDARLISESVGARYERLLGPAHPYTAGARANHALVLLRLGAPEQARVLAERALADLTAAVGEHHPWTLGCAVNAAALRTAVGDPESGAALSRRTAAGAGDRLGGRHPLTLCARIALAADLGQLRRHREAEQIESEALAALTAVLGARHPQTVAARKRVRPYWDFEPQTT
ncbi:FxSxx-COOH system tetratricopeptide repeat protein [Streptomyces caeni]